MCVPNHICILSFTSFSAPVSIPLSHMQVMGQGPVAIARYVTTILMTDKEAGVANNT